MKTQVIDCKEIAKIAIEHRVSRGQQYLDRAQTTKDCITAGEAAYKDAFRRGADVCLPVADAMERVLLDAEDKTRDALYARVLGR